MVDGNERLHHGEHRHRRDHRRPTTPPTSLLRDADAAMYLAKARGRDRYEIFDEELRTQATERLRTETYLRRALDAGRDRGLLPARAHAATRG